MIIDINVISFNRPDLVKTLLASIAAQEPGDYEIGTIRLFQDGPRAEEGQLEADLVDEAVATFKAAFPQGQVFRAAQNSGINGNYESLWRSFENADADAQLVFEDDLDLRPCYFRIMAKLLRHAETNPNIGLVSAVGLLGASPDHQARYANALIPMGTVWGVHRWGWGATRGLIRDMMPLIRYYFSVTAKLGYKDNGSTGDFDQSKDVLLKFFMGLGYAIGDYTTAHDVLYDLIANSLGRLHLSTYASFAKSTGKRGTHFDPILFKRFNYNAPVSEIPEPETFTWYTPEMLLDIMTLQGRFFTNFLANYKSPTFSVDAPVPNLTKGHLIRYLYEHIFGWPCDILSLQHHLIIPSGKYAKPEMIAYAENVLATSWEDNLGLISPPTGRRKPHNYAPS